MRFFIIFVLVVAVALLVCAQHPPSTSRLPDLNEYCDLRNRLSGAADITGPRGPTGKSGPRGRPGVPGVMSATEVKEIVKNIVYSSDVDAMIRKIVYEGVPRSCQEVYAKASKIRNETGGVFDVHPEFMERTELYCDLETDGGGWTVFQRRMDGSVDFYRGWDDYVTGFGKKDGEFWLGLENLYQMTENGSYELRVDLEDFSGNTAYAKYRSFSIGPASDNYRFRVSSYSGTAGDSLDYNNGYQFTTKDRDHDVRSGSNCGQYYKSGWWHRNCAQANINAIYHSSGSGQTGVAWYQWKRTWEYLKFTEMKFRKKD